MKTFIFFTLFSLSSFAQFFNLDLPPIENRSQNLCLQCSISVQQIFNFTSIANAIQIEAGREQNKNQKMIISIANQQSLRELEMSVFNRLSGHLQSTAIGKALMKMANNGHLRYRLFYQLGLDKNLQPYLYNQEGAPTYELEKKDSHELWGFSKSDGENGVVALNQYQNLTSAKFTLVHELFHLFDQQTANYLKIYSSEALTELDIFALEFRAFYAEIIFFQQNKQFESSVDNKKIQEFYKMFASNGGIDIKKASDHVLDSLFPLKTSKTLALNEESHSSVNHFSMNYGNIVENSKKEFPNAVLQDGILSAVSWFFNESLLNCENGQCSDISLAILDYKESAGSSYSEAGYSARKRIEELITSRLGSGATLTTYLEKYNLLDNQIAAESLRPIGLNTFSSVIPSPRINGGGRLKTQSGLYLESENAPVSVSKEKVKSVEKLSAAEEKTSIRNRRLIPAANKFNLERPAELKATEKGQ